MMANVQRATAGGEVIESRVVSETVPGGWAAKDDWGDWISLPFLAGAHGFYGANVRTPTANNIQSVAYFDAETTCVTSGKYCRTGFVAADVDFEAGRIRFKKFNTSIYNFNGSWTFYIW